MTHKEFSVTNWCVENKTSVYLFSLIITLAGLAIYQNLPKALFPDIVVPTVLVTTIYPGNSPDDVENLITKEIEQELKSVKDVKRIKSNSIENFSAITVEFNTTVDVAIAKQRVTDAVDKAKAELPDDLDDDPAVAEVDFSEFPIMNINLAGNYDLAKLKEYAELLQDDIEEMPEITRVDIVGALNREIKVNVDLYRMQAAGITFGDISQAVSGANVNVSGGDINMEGVRRNLRVTGEFKDIETLRNIVVRSARGATVFLKEIAEVADGYEEKQDYARLDNRAVITLNVIKRSGENLILASDKIEEIIQQRERTTLPEGLNITVTGDQSESTRTQLNDLVNTVVLGFIFVVLILMFFMGTTNAIFVGLSVPLSFLMALLLMPVLGYTLNTIVIFAFLLGLGIVVDDAIVVIENAHRIFHDNKNVPIKQAVRMAAGEVFVPVFSGTLTTIAPFFPLLFWPGIVGEFMKYLPVTLIITLFASLFVAFVINPVFAVSFMKREDGGEVEKLSRLVRPLTILAVLAGIGYLLFGVGAGNFVVFILLLYLLNNYVFTPLINRFQAGPLPALKNGYRRLISFVIHGWRPVLFLGGTVLMLVLVIVLTAVRQPKIEFFPSGDPAFVYVYNKLPIGTDAAVTDSVTKVIEQRVYEVIGTKNPIVKSVISNVGIGAGDPQNPDRVVAPNKSKVTVAFVDLDQRIGVSTREIMEKIRAKMVGLPGSEISVEQEQSGPPTGKPIQVEIAGEDFDQLLRLQNQVKTAINQSGIQGIEELKSDLQLNKPEITIDIDREKAAREGISLAVAGTAIRTAVYGLEVSQYREAKDEYPITVRLRESDRNSAEKLLALNISYFDQATAGFRQIPLNAIAKAEYSTTFSTINRKNQERLVTLSSNVLTGYNANEIVGEINQLIGEIAMPVGYTVKMGGEQEDQQETSGFLSVAFGAALALIFLILVTQFNSVSKPLIILFTIVLSLIGVLLGFVLTGMTISIVMTGVGIIALAGIVVKNGIILIEFIDELRARGDHDLREAIIDGGATRLTPVILTAAAAVLGLIPLAIGLNVNFVTLFTRLDPELFIGGESTVFWGPLAWTIIFGLTFATFLTLIIVPTMYWLTERLKLKRKGGKVEDKQPVVRERTTAPAY
ncbi:MAG: efflux RND transporter permease subunit [Ferruginibacter sp.]|nr:efflux RND transporter permease subunit [Cytophagales bacterium]